MNEIIAPRYYSSTNWTTPLFSRWYLVRTSWLIAHNRLHWIAATHIMYCVSTWIDAIDIRIVQSWEQHCEHSTDELAKKSWLILSCKGGMFVAQFLLIAIGCVSSCIRTIATIALIERDKCLILAERKQQQHSNATEAQLFRPYQQIHSSTEIEWTGLFAKSTLVISAERFHQPYDALKAPSLPLTEFHTVLRTFNLCYYQSDTLLFLFRIFRPPPLFMWIETQLKMYFDSCDYPLRN